MASDILIVDDEADIRDLVAGILEDEGFKTRTARDSDSALAEIANRRPHLVFLDIWLQGSKLDGLQLLEQIKKDHADVPVVMISGHGNIETAVAAIKRGAYDFIEKPFKSDRLILVATRALETSRLKREVKELKQLAPDRERSHRPLRLHEPVAPDHRPGGQGQQPHPDRRPLRSRARNWRRARCTMHRAVPRDRSSSSTPRRSRRSGWKSNCSASSSRTASRRARPGALEEAHGGTLFIDEIADMPRETQNKILRVLVDQTFQRSGGTAKVHVDVRIISSTARNLEEEIAEGRFREDLYHRLSVVPIRVPPLSERREDIPELIDYFMDQISSATGLPKRQIGQDAMAVLQSHVWPGNVRQLRNNVERVMILAGGGPEAIITADMLPQDVGSMVPAMPTSNNGEHIMGLPLREAREVFERDYLIAQISRFSGNISRTAEFVGMERSALHRKLKALGVG